ncbi:hypothetical protein U0355_13055 [Salimicrobium sp. PL1-032A]|uniref:hypothetical protein n=1 Tax=Salimicrobium sp. PL1-032A TaxID=3095364 RepID=UPI0032618B42
MAEPKQTLLTKLQSLFHKEEQTENKYIQKREEKTEEVMKMQDELADKEAHVKGIHKMKMLDEVTEETYKTEQKELEQLENKLAEARKELDLIDQYKHEDAKKILGQLEEVRAEHEHEERAEIRKIRLEMLQAKLEYAEYLIEARKRYYEVTQPKRKVDQLKDKLGIKRRIDVSGGFEKLHQVDLSENERFYCEQLTFQQHELFRVLEDGTPPEILRTAVDKAKKDGVLK